MISEPKTQNDINNDKLNDMGFRHVEKPYKPVENGGFWGPPNVQI